MNYEKIKYLVVDVESVPDGKLIGMVKYPGLALSGEEAIRRFQDEVLAATDGRTEFIPVTFQYPVSICIAKVEENFSLNDIVCLDEPDFRAGEMVRLFWHGVEELYRHSSIVTFNGRGFDIPLLELMAYRYGYVLRNYFRDKYGVRYRFGTKHIDLQDFLSNFNAIRMTGGLNLLAKVLGKPGKSDVSGDAVYGMFREGKLREINDYCIHDVLDTYFVFLRSRVMTGELTLNREQQIVAETKHFIRDNAERIPALGTYHENWGDWYPWP